MGSINFDFDFSDLDKFLTNFEKEAKKLDEKLERQIRLTGSKMQREYKRLAPKKTGKFSRQLKGKTSVSFDVYTYSLKNTANWGKGIFVMNEKGTKLRHRTKLKKTQKKNGYYSTGMVKPRGLTTRIKKETKIEFQRRMEKLFQELGGSL